MMNLRCTNYEEEHSQNIRFSKSGGTVEIRSVGRINDQVDVYFSSFLQHLKQDKRTLARKCLVNLIGIFPGSFSSANRIR
jgi:hypothetical protein